MVGRWQYAISEPQWLLANVPILGGGVSSPGPKGLNLKEGEKREDMRERDRGEKVARNGREMGRFPDYHFNRIDRLLILHCIDI